MTTWTESEVNETLEKLFKQPATNIEFRKLCLSDPGAAIKQVSGKEIPSGLKIKFVENEGADRTLVLPDLLTEDLSEDDLDNVAGGHRQGVDCKF
ncbi:MAG: NHLP leader peptide family natural product precursor [Firmicutes bacterium]|nr:NHLP leader peptide family natural product precursor [Bacillota bacterium]